MTDNEERLGLGHRDLPEPTDRDKIDTSMLRPADDVPVPPRIFIEATNKQTFLTEEQPQQSGPTERELLWRELDSLIDQVKAHGIDALSPYEFALYELLLPMFRDGFADTIFVLRRFVRRYRGAPEHLVEFERACRFAMQPSGDALDENAFTHIYREAAKAHGHKVEGDDPNTNSSDTPEA